MNLIIKYKAVILVVLPVLILVLIRSVSPNHFKPDVKKWAEPSLMQSNIISKDKLGTLTGEKLIVNLDNGNADLSDPANNVINMNSADILIKDNLKTIKNHKGPVVIYSDETALSSRIWMVLSQLGCKNIYILTNDTEIEVLKYKLVPDSTLKSGMSK
jgi:hypothetical protein